MALGERHLDPSALKPADEGAAPSVLEPCGESFAGEMGELDYESLPTDRLSAHLVAGSAAGIMEHCMMYPVDCVKVSSSCLPDLCPLVHGGRGGAGCPHTRGSMVSGHSLPSITPVSLWRASKGGVIASMTVQCQTSFLCCGSGHS